MSDGINCRPTFCLKSTKVKILLLFYKIDIEIVKKLMYNKHKVKYFYGGFYG